MGNLLQVNKIAIDKSYAYFGIYSLQELELYKSQTRYVTFVEVVKNKYSITDTGLGQNINGGFGVAFLGCGMLYHIVGAGLPRTAADGTDNSSAKSALQVLGFGLDATGLLFLLTAGSQSKTIANFEGVYNIYEEINRFLSMRSK